MISGIIFILISWLAIHEYAPNLLWLSIVLTVFGAIKIQVSALKYVMLFFKGANSEDDSCGKYKGDA